MLVTEAAASPPVLIRHRAHRPEAGIGDAAGAEDALGQFDARVADVYARARDQLADLILRCPAESAGQSGVRRPAAGLAFRSAALLDNLVKLLAAESQRGSDVPRPRARRDQAVHSTAELRPGSFCFVLEMFQPFLRLPGLGQQLLIHIAHSS